MKKMFASVIIALFSASGIFAEGFKDRFTGMLGGGVSVPVSHLKARGMISTESKRFHTKTSMITSRQKFRSRATSLVV